MPSRQERGESQWGVRKSSSTRLLSDVVYIHPRREMLFYEILHRQSVSILFQPDLFRTLTLFARSHCDHWYNQFSRRDASMLEAPSKLSGIFIELIGVNKVIIFFCNNVVFT